MTIIQETMDFCPKAKYISSNPSVQIPSRGTKKVFYPQTAAEGNISVSAFCARLEKLDIHIGRNQMFRWLRKSGYIAKQKNTWNMPLQKYIAQGLFTLKETFVLISDEQVPRYSPLITPKGTAFLIGELKSTADSGNKLKSAK